MLVVSFLIFPASNETYNLPLIRSPQIEPLTFGMSVSDVDMLALGELGHSSLTLAADLLPL
jgi:hypothetical protein